MAEKAERGRRGKRRVVVELYRRDESGKVCPNGRLVTEYSEGRRGGVVAPPERHQDSCDGR